MLATRQVLGNIARSRAVTGTAASGVRRMATVSDSPLDRKVSIIFAQGLVQLVGVIQRELLNHA